MSVWKEAAERARQAGYHPGNPWERMLRKHLLLHFPNLAHELGPELNDYLQAEVHRVMTMEDQLLDGGTDPQAARELAMAELLREPEGERHPTEPWELEGAQATMSEAALRWLTRPASPKSLPRTTPPT